jgi:D-apionolactonase
MANADRPRPLRAGGLHAEYHRGDLRYVRLGNIPLLDRLYVRIRDREWRTVPMRAELAVLDRTGTTFRVVARLTWGEEPWASGTLEVSASGAELFACATVTFHQRVPLQRVGLNLHHPLASSIGRTYQWANGGSSGTGRFPAVIHPQVQGEGRYLPMIGPFHELAIGAAPRTVIVLAFSGELFETEDQRNWTDASFKTYAPPLGKHGPRLHEVGSVVQQSVRVTVRGPRPGPDQPVPAAGAGRDAGPPASRLPMSRPAERGPAGVIASPRLTPASPLPPLGVTTRALWPAASGLPGVEAAVDHVRADIWPDGGDAVRRLRSSLAAAHDSGIPLELALRGGEADPARVRQVLRMAAEVPVRAILATGPDTGPPATGFAATVRALSRRAGIRAPVAAGTAGNFSEINRSRESVRDAGTVVWSTSPQVHESDDLTVMQAAPIIGQTVISAAQIWPGQQAAVSGIRLAPPQAPDPRAARPFGAAWLVAVLAGLTGTNCAWVTVDLPLATGRAGRRALSPAARVLMAVRQFRGLPLAQVPAPGPALAVLAVHLPRGLRLLVANLSWRPQRVRLPGRPGTAELVSGGAPGPGGLAGSGPELTLPPYGVVHATVPR